MKKVMFLALLLSLASCVSVGRKLDQASVEKIKKGETTKEQVLKLIGSPEQVTTLYTGDTVWSYHFFRATAKAVNFVPVVGAFTGGANTQNQMLSLTFGSDGIVKNIMSTHGYTESDSGLSTASKAGMSDVEENKRPK